MPAAARPATHGRKPRAPHSSSWPAASSSRPPFGTFVAPNISPDPNDGIGAWSIEDFANAMLRGVSPSGQHFYPAFPYTSYARMQPADVADLFAYHEDAAGRRRQGAAAPARLSVQHPARPRPVEAALSQRPAGASRSPTMRPTRSGSAAIWSKGRAIAANAIRRAPSPAASKKDAVAGRRARGRRARASFPTSPRARAASATGRKPTSPTISRPASRRISIRSAGRWSTSRRTSRCCTDADRAAIAAYLKAVPPHPNGYPAKAKPAG